MADDGRPTTILIANLKLSAKLSDMEFVKLRELGIDRL